MLASILEWITTLAAFTTALTVLLIWKQIRTDHERSRREGAIGLMKWWLNLGRTPAVMPLIRFVEVLEEQQCEKLLRSEAFYISSEHEELFRQCLHLFKDDVSVKVDNGKIQVNRRELNLIRSALHGYLNALETVATAWRHHVVDRDIIKEEFKSVVSYKTNRFVLENFRKVTGYYPSISEFTDAISKSISYKESKRKVA